MSTTESRRARERLRPKWEGTDRLLTWAELREYVLDRDNHKCQICYSADATEVDHIWPQYWGGRDDLENLQAACRSCNATKGQRVDWYLARTEDIENAYAATIRRMCDLDGDLLALLRLLVIHNDPNLEGRISVLERLANGIWADLSEFQVPIVERYELLAEDIAAREGDASGWDSTTWCVAAGMAFPDLRRLHREVAEAMRDHREDDGLIP